ncbi:MAG: choice-of-anchor L domain-containing protein, partial [Flavobacteriaceae bacterium]|nr:choice-of-anchor L domain-containing protein [Flavobacteriaceae bacterium]
MMKKLLFPLILLFSVMAHSQFITIDESLTVQQLVEDVLINSPCASTSNYGSRTGTDFGEGNGIGYFNANGSNFPYVEGVILSSGFINEAPGPNNNVQVNGSVNWPGDIDLETATGNFGETGNASFIQFEFVPLISNISFNFIFASEEYNQGFECQFSDAFAFILIDLTTGVTQNLAVLPGTAIPIEATNIHPDVPGGCPAINEQYFDRYNELPFNDPNLAAINFNGQIKSLIAEGTVVPGNPYTIKLVIADDGDTVWDSAVFLEAGSFNIGVDLGDDLTIADGTAPCEGLSLEIGVAPDITGQTTYLWYVWDPVALVFDLIPGETSNTIIITQSGTYQIETIFSGGCSATDDVVIEFAPQPVAGIPDDIITCDEVPNDGLALFDLTIRDVQIINSQPNTVLTYHVSLADAESGTLPITPPNAYTNTIPGYQIIFARLEEAQFGCFDIVELVLQVDQAPSITDPITDYFICDNDQDNTEVFDLTSKDAEILNTLINVTLSYHNTQA